MSSEHPSDILANVALPNTEATITVRVIKSFEYRTERNLVLHKLNLPVTTVGDLKNIAKEGVFNPAMTMYRRPSNAWPAIQSGPPWKPYRNAALGYSKYICSAVIQITDRTLARYPEGVHQGAWIKGIALWRTCLSPQPRYGVDLKPDN